MFLKTTHFPWFMSICSWEAGCRGLLSTKKPNLSRFWFMHTQHLRVNHPLINAKTPPCYPFTHQPFFLETLPGYYLSFMQEKDNCICPMNSQTIKNKAFSKHHCYLQPIPGSWSKKWFWVFPIPSWTWVWELNSSPLQEQGEHLIAEPSFQPFLFTFLFIYLHLFVCVCVHHKPCL